MRIAIVGSYGNGKTTLSTALADRLGIPRVHATPMALGEGALRTSLEECDDHQLVQLVSRRLIERVTAESSARDAGFVSDGSVLHEFVYADTRLRFGLHPDSADAVPTDAVSPESTALGAIAKEVVAYAEQTYDMVIAVPNERPLVDTPPPISEPFRSILDASMLNLLRKFGLPYVGVAGDETDRLKQAVDRLGILMCDS
ncbi:AAA family ATPase [Rhodococcus sovatensis]|uniref:AAA family ATPase n=1 Tax=Rhodococcus sovatensis TaxID=1805840 RepID=A0ABZ2PMU9_9NOCA